MKYMKVWMITFLLLTPITEGKAKTKEVFLQVVRDDKTTPIKQATFQLTYEGILIQQDIESDKNGMVSIDGLEIGSYSIRQTSGEDGYCISNESIPFYYEGEGIDLGVIINKKMYGSLELLALDEKQQPLANTTFTLRRLEEEQPQTYRTDKKGKGAIDHLELGDYLLHIKNEETKVSITSTNYQQGYEVQIIQRKEDTHKKKTVSFSSWVLFGVLSTAIISSLLIFAKKEINDEIDPLEE